ncbi:MAG: hypothetical protein DI623_12890 [Sphingomonas sanxanigenens]|uniref:DUF3618 domain-containing protein n=1 Tax=Sphingomonas sanxanigenens TaxID=397260 RepID=A0A2W5BZ37_9SPHN|nr:MAG: hypothetical protein DI623_12890 [Sphingomonas sanxanigenens]
MSKSKYDLERAEAESAAARAQLTATMVRIQKRFHPQTLMLEAGRELRQWGAGLVNDGVETARRNPGATAALLAAAAAWLLRKPLIKRAARLFGFHDATQLSPDELIARAISAAAARAPASEPARSSKNERRPRARKGGPARQGGAEAGTGEGGGAGKDDARA